MISRHSLAFVIVSLLPSTGFAQAWTRDSGSAFTSVSVTHLAGGTFFGPDGQKRELASTYSQTTLGFYSEVGVVDRWLTLTLGGEALRRNALADQGATFGVGDLKLGLYTGLVTTPFRLTFGVQVGLPTGDDHPSSGTLDEEAELIARSLPTGDGEVDVEPQLLFGYGFGGGAWPLRHYTVGALGYGIRTRGFSDQLTYRAELGTSLPLGVLEHVWLVARISGVRSFASDEAAAGFVGLGNGVSYTAAGVELSVRLPAGFGVSAGADTAFAARNVISAIPVHFALWWQG